MTGLEQGLSTIAITFSAIQLIFIGAGIIVFSFFLALAEAIYKKLRGIGRKDIKYRRAKW